MYVTDKQSDSKYAINLAIQMGYMFCFCFLFIF